MPLLITFGHLYIWGSPRDLGVPGALGVLGGCSLAGKVFVCKIWHGSGQRLQRYEQGKIVTSRVTHGVTGGPRGSRGSLGPQGLLEVVVWQARRVCAKSAMDGGNGCQDMSRAKV